MIFARIVTRYDELPADGENAKHASTGAALRRFNNNNICFRPAKKSKKIVPTNTYAYTVGARFDAFCSLPAGMNGRVTLKIISLENNYDKRSFFISVNYVRVIEMKYS